MKMKWLKGGSRKAINSDPPGLHVTQQKAGEECNHVALHYSATAEADNEMTLPGQDFQNDEFYSERVGARSNRNPEPEGIAPVHSHKSALSRQRLEAAPMTPATEPKRKIPLDPSPGVSEHSLHDIMPSPRTPQTRNYNPSMASRVKHVSLVSPQKQSTSGSVLSSGSYHLGTHSIHSAASSMSRTSGSLATKRAPILSRHQSTPITKHYDIARQILSAFESHYSNKLWMTAYCVGMQFVETALLEIPKHGYYLAARHETDRMQSCLDAARVAHLLEEIIIQAREQTIENDDSPESIEAATMLGDLEKIREFQEMAMKQVELASNDQDQRDQDQGLAPRTPQGRKDMQHPNSTSRDSWEHVAAGHRQSDVMEPPPLLSSHLEDDNEGQRQTSIVQLEKALFLSGLELATSEPTEGFALAEMIEGSESSERDHERDFGMSLSALMPSGIFDERGHRRDESAGLSQPPLTPYQTDAFTNSFVMGNMSFTMGHNRRASSALIELQTLATLYQEDFQALQEEGRVRISFADTYQGRVPESTNGCAVIAPLLCIHHLLNDEFYYNSRGEGIGLTHEEVIQVIDEETPVILKAIRKQLGLSDQAFLIPSDVHDYLMQNGQLAQEQFLTVTGGNILDERHLDALLVNLGETKGDSKRRISATLFFHEHVVSILRLPRQDNSKKYCYEFIDSLPLRRTIRRENETDEEMFRRYGIPEQLMSVCSMNTNHHDGGASASAQSIEQNSSIESQEDDPDAEMFESYSHLLGEEAANADDGGAIIPQTARIRCNDSEALMAVIRWYACSMFNVENITYINQYPWDDATCDFDPRVFQAFVWTS